MRPPGRAPPCAYYHSKPRMIQNMRFVRRERERAAPLMGAYFARRCERVIIGAEIPLLQRARAGRSFLHFQRSQTFKPQRSQNNTPWAESERGELRARRSLCAHVPNFGSCSATVSTAPSGAARASGANEARTAARGSHFAQFPAFARLMTRRKSRATVRRGAAVCEFFVNAIDKPRGLCYPGIARR